MTCMDQPIGRTGGMDMELQAALDRQRHAFDSAPMPTARQRQDLLRRLESLIRDNQAALATAISADFGNRSRVETAVSEILPTLAACAHARRHLAAWMRPQRRAVGLNFQPATNRVEYTPLGVVGVVAPWNYPVFLTLGPLVDILAAGNRAMIKPSELTPRTGLLLEQVLGAAFSPEEVLVVNVLRPALRPPAVHRLHLRRARGDARRRRKPGAGHPGTGRQVAGHRRR
jgi:coniferyl-aldehyde dehydrogenase